jgi:hypothetical protein
MTFSEGFTREMRLAEECINKEDEPGATVHRPLADQMDDNL